MKHGWVVRVDVLFVRVRVCVRQDFLGPDAAGLPRRRAMLDNHTFFRENRVKFEISTTRDHKFRVKQRFISPSLTFRPFLHPNILTLDTPKHSVKINLLMITTTTLLTEIDSFPKTLIIIFTLAIIEQIQVFSVFFEIIISELFHNLSIPNQLALSLFGF